MMTRLSKEYAMLSRNQIVSQIEDSGLVAVIRADSPDQLVDVCQALRDGGVTVSEITMTTPGALDAIKHATDKLGEGNLVGVGSVLDAETARMAILAGAQYVVGPTTNYEVIEMAHRYGKPVIPGGLTPTEVINAYQAGADLVKVFPANHFGPKYFKDLLAPMPQLKLTPTGGVDLTTVKDWIDAGAAALGVGSALVKKDLIKAKDFKGLTNLAKQFTEAVKAARGG
jgi:2-dehydro-3-deoxyphosphogluconate aldolase/(4S)-4-hydroxy-2-oxoglutarate aldolase